MKFLSILLLIPLVHSLAFDSAACAKNCTATVSARVCASDLALYDDECRARCGAVDNFVLLPCGNLTDAQCKNICTQQYNNMVCQISAKTQDQLENKTAKPTLRCSNYGTLFSSLRVSQCMHSDIAEAFDCTTLGLSSANCNAKCANIYAAQKTCAAEARNPICAIDSLIYRNACELNLLLAKPAEGFGADQVASAKNCQDYVLLRYGIITGAPAKPSRGTN